MAVKQILGKVTVTPKGEYSSGETYKRLDIVTSNGQSYIAKVDNTGVDVTNTNTWLQLVEKPEKGIDYFTEEDIAQLVSMVTDDSESEFNEYYNGKVSDFNSNASSKTSEFNSNYDEKVESFNTIFDTSTDNFDGNYETKLSAFNENASTQTSTFNSVVEQATSDFNSNASTLTEMFNTNASDKTSAFNINASEKTQEFNDNVDEKTEQITSQLDNYVQFDNYPSNEKAGVVKSYINGFQVSSSGNPYAKEYTAEEYDNVGNQDFIGKGTLENAKDKIVGSSIPVQDLTATVTNVQNDQDESMPKQTASGEIVSVDDAIAYKTFNVTVDGASEQETTSGNQLVDWENNISKSTGISFSFIDDVLIVIGVPGGDYQSVTYDITDLIKNNPGKTINYKDDSHQITNSSSESMAQIAVRYSDGTPTFYRVVCNYKTNQLSSYKIPDDISNINRVDLSIFTNNSANTDVTNTVTVNKPLLYFDNNNIYEPYTGGQPSPSPDYPQEITTLTFDKITRCGKNLFDVNDTSFISDSVSIDDDGWININIDNSSGTDTKFANVWTYPKYNIKVNTSYKLVLEIKSHSGNNGYLSPVSNDKSSYSQFNNQYQYFFYNIVDNSISVYDMLSQKSFDKAKTMLRTFVACYAGEKLQITFRISVLEDTSVTPQNFIYEPYQATEYAIDLQGNEMVELPNGVKDELVIDKYGNVSLIKNVGKVIYTNTNNFDNNGQNNKRIQYLTPVIENIPLSYGDQLDNIFKSNVISSIYVQDGTSFAGTTTTSKIRVSISREILNIQEESNSGYLNALNELLQLLNESGNPFTIYYPLAEPQPISLGKLSDIITTLNGTNNISINGNIPTTISTTYALDIKKYIDKKIAELSAQLIKGE